MKIKKCKICGNEFESYNGKEVCGPACELVRKKEYDRIGNYRRYHGLSGQPEKKICPICNKEFEGLRNKYCGKTCSNIARKMASKELFKEYYKNNREQHIENVKNNRIGIDNNDN